MNLQRVPRHEGAVNQRIVTTCCNRLVARPAVLADLDGKFGDFWCEDCAMAAGHVMPDTCVSQFFYPE